MAAQRTAQQPAQENNSRNSGNFHKKMEENFGNLFSDSDSDSDSDTVTLPASDVTTVVFDIRQWLRTDEFADQ